VLAEGAADANHVRADGAGVDPKIGGGIVIREFSIPYEDVGDTTHRRQGVENFMKQLRRLALFECDVGRERVGRVALSDALIPGTASQSRLLGATNVDATTPDHVAYEAREVMESRFAGVPRAETHLLDTFHDDVLGDVVGNVRVAEPMGELVGKRVDLEERPVLDRVRA
jgi:hypothetical protein